MSIAFPHAESEQTTTTGGSLAADSLVSGLSFMLFANLFQRGIGFVRNLALCRILADDQMGLWALASSFFILAAPLAVLGLPGTFGRLVESYRVSGQLSSFIQRVACVSSVGVLGCTAWLMVSPATSSSLIFGVELSLNTMIAIAMTLCLVILFNATTELLSGLRKPRIVSAMHTCNSLAFTVASLGGLLIINDWRVLIVAFAISAGVGLIPAIPALLTLNNIAPSLQPALAHGEMWKRVLPFAVSVWCMNLLVNLFDVVDRYMLLYLAADTAEQGRALVGQFHSGRIMPVLLSSLTLMLGSLLLPYLAAEWEAGKRKEVRESMRLTFKCATLFFLALSVASLAVAPLMFDLILKGKYADGLAIMPQAMLHCCLTAMGFLMQNYFWCTERGKTVGIIIAIGLVMNIGLNALWVPSWGLHGAVLATSVSGGVILVITMHELKRSGVPLGVECVWFGLLPLSLMLGSVPAAFVLAAALILSGRTTLLFTPQEKSLLDNAITPKLRRLGFRYASVWP